MLIYDFWRQVWRGVKLGQRFLRQGDQVCCQQMEKHAQEVEREDQRKKDIIRTTQRHNMATHPDEPYYQKQYWYFIERALTQLPREIRKYSILDLGCGQGRFTLPLAQWVVSNGGGRVIGVDISASALEFARQSAANAGINDRCQFLEADILTFIQNFPSASCQAIVCTEVFFVLPQYQEVCREVARVLIPGGKFFCSVRSRYFNILHSIADRKWSALPILLKNREGFPWGPPGWFSWHTVQEITEILVLNRFEVSPCWGIGVCSGIKGDPLARIARPSDLAEWEQEELMKVELSLAEEMANCGRYILLEATKRE